MSLIYRMFHRPLSVCGWFAAALALSLPIGPVPAANADWPYWRGPRFDGAATAQGLVDDWNPKGGRGSNVVWERDDIGGICTPITLRGRLYTIIRAEPATPREGEKVVCLDAKTGQTIWEHKYNVTLSDVPAERIGWSSVVGDPDTGNVYILGACNIFMCLKGDTGQVVWSTELQEQFGMLNTYGGRTNFPIIHEDLVITSGVVVNWGDAARPNHRVIAFDKLTGQPVWFSGTKDLPEDTTYSAPSITTVDGQRQLILGCGDGALWSFQPRTGKPLWSYYLSRRGLYATPLVVGDRVFAGHSEENMTGSAMGAMVALKLSGSGDQTKAEELWKIDGLVCGNSEPVLVDDRLYVVDDRCKLWVIHAETGELIVEQKAFVGSRQKSALLLADDKIYVMTENGRWAIIRPTPDGFEMINKGNITNVDFSASPIVSDGLLYFQSSDALYCVGDGNGTQADIDMFASYGDEAPVADHPAATQLRLSPVESLVRPGQSVAFTVTAYNQLGQQVPTPGGLSLSVAGPGSSTPGGAIQGLTYTAPADATHTGVVVTAKAGDAVGTARVRIVPPLPWNFTFDRLNDPPLSWVGARYRNVVRDIDGSPALVKVNTIPKGARSMLWMGPSDLQNYTIAADVRGTRMSDQLPDIGVIAQGYVMDLMGQSQQLQIRTWAAQLRMAKTVDFPWKENTWYRMKLRAEVESEGPAATVILKGKVWPRDEPEPKEWTITARDESPILRASPGLYGNAKVAELSMDNIQVTPNEPEQ